MEGIPDLKGQGYVNTKCLILPPLNPTLPSRRVDSEISIKEIPMAFWKNRRRISDGTLDGLVKVRGRSKLSMPSAKYTPSSPPSARFWQPRSLTRGMTGKSLNNSFGYSGQNRGEFYRWLRDTVPIISTGVWTWVRLCATNLSQRIEGSASERHRAAHVLSELDRRILEIPYGRGSGLTKLSEACFLELFTTGRFAGEAVIGKDGKSVDHFRFIDPYRVSWIHSSDGWIPYLDGDDDQGERIDPQRFFYGTLGTDISNPAGIEPLACIPFVAEVEQMMLEDMARSSHNAGTPRIQVKIARPERFGWEGDSEFVNRANSYFKDIVSEFQHLEPDDNIFTWNDVEVTVVGGSGLRMAWRLNREQVIEDVITGLRLFPWVLGRTHGTTKNWVQSQFDLLMQMVSTYQTSGIDLVNWICAVELELQGVKANVTHYFDSHPDPFRLQKVQAEKIELENINFKVRNGYISRVQGAKEMGYVKPHRLDDNLGNQNINNNLQEDTNVSL